LVEYKFLLDQKSNKLSSEVISVTELGKEHLDKIGKFLKANFSGEITVSNKIDKSLIGGFQIKVGDLIIDQSVKNHMQKLKDKLLLG
ncbi:MAG: ATP synthase F1 subunit delta, partial [Calditrichaeota bacterium]|nr:ATP synthase F1 subunit delta [Calditrichota bacterium]